MEEKKLNERESLELIAQMIRNTKQNLENKNGNTFIIWGSTTLIVTLLTAAVVYWSSNAAFNWLWMLIPIVGTLWSRLSGNEKKIVTTHIDKVIRQVWVVIMATAIMIPLIMYLFVSSDMETIAKPSTALFAFVPFAELLVCSIGLTITGAVIDFKAAKVGGFVGIVLSLFTFLSLPGGVYSIFALWALVSMIIPGIKLNIYVRKHRENV